MTRDEILHLAEQVGCGWARNGTEPALLHEEKIVAFAVRVAAVERAACAEIADEYEYQLVAGSCARDIRARGETYAIK